MKAMRMIVFVMALTAPSAAGSAEPGRAHAYLDAKTFSQMAPDARALYVMGLADAFAYIARQGGYLDGLNECLEENKVTPRVAESLLSKILEQPDSRALLDGRVPAAQVFEIAQRVACATYLRK